MGKPTGFLEYNREVAKVLPPKVRIANFKEFRTPLNKEKQKLQGARCMACGVPFCQAGMMIGGMASGCPLHNLVPETNDLVYTGNWKQAFLRLNKTHSFPEFTSRVCPALCEAACTCNLNGEPVSTKENERAIIETAYAQGWVKPQPPAVRTGKNIAVVGSGPSGLAAAQQLNRRGHSVTVFERSDRIGGLLRYGIPNMKLEKSVIDRRLKLMEEEGVKFVTNTNVGVDITAEELLKKFDRVILCCGASNPRDIKVPGRDAKGIYFAVDFLKKVTKTLLDSDFTKAPYEDAKGKHVLVIGGGPAGLSASINVRARGRSALVVSNPLEENPLWRAEKVDNYLGLPGLSGAEMLAAMRRHAEQAGVEFLAGKVLNAVQMPDAWYVSVGPDMYNARAVVLAAGVARGKKFAGEAELLGRGVSYCATCDGMLYRGKPVAVVGYTDTARQEAEFLQKIGCSVTYFDRPKQCEIRGDGRVESVTCDGRTIPAEGVFILRPTMAPTELFPGLAVEQGYVTVDRRMATNLPGLFAAGDCTGGPLQVSKAAGDGLIAGQSAAAWAAAQERREKQS